MPRQGTIDTYNTAVSLLYDRSTISITSTMDILYRIITLSYNSTLSAFFLKNFNSFVVNKQDSSNSEYRDYPWY